MLSDRQRRKGAKRTRLGGGLPLEPFRWWHLLSGRSLFSLELLRTDGTRAGYAIDVRVRGKLAGDFGMVHRGVNAPQLLEPVLQIPPIEERVGHYESPLRLPLWLNLALGLGAGLASTERALRLKFHWLLDGVGT